MRGCGGKDIPSVEGRRERQPRRRGVVEGVVEPHHLDPLHPVAGGEKGQQAVARRHEKLILRAQTLATEIGYVRESALADENLGEMMMARRKYKEAVANLSDALNLARKIAPEGDIVAECLRRLAEAKYHLNRPESALEHIEDGMEVARKCGEYYEMGYFYRTRSLCHSRLGNTDAAIKDIEKSIETFERYGNPFERAVSLRVLGRMLAQKGEESHLLKSRNALSDSAIEFGKQEEGREQILSYAVLATVDMRLGNMDDALLSVYEALRLVEEEHDQKFRKALLALRNKIERHMSRATTNVIDQFSVLGDIQSGARSREQLADGFPSIPGATFPDVINGLRVTDYSAQPPQEGPAYPVFVPTVDAAGNELAGIRLPTVSVPLATYLGWNLAKAGYAEGSLCSVIGSTLPFAKTRAQREAGGDPRLSIEERYESVGAYVEAIERAARALVDKRLLLEEDVNLYVEMARQRDIGLSDSTAVNR